MSELFLIVRIAGRWVALPAIEIESAVDIGPITPVPGAPAAIRGLSALRSRVVTVIDSALALGLPAGGAPGRAVIAQVHGHHYALLVEALEDVFALERQPVSAGLAFDGPWGFAAAGIVERDGEPLLILDLARLIPGALPAAA